MSEETSIDLVIQQTPTVALLDPHKREELYAFLEREIETFVPDLSTEASRKKIAALAYKVARTKTAIDDAGAALKAEWLKKSQAIDLSRREIRDRLDALKEKARKPLTEWEEAEERREKFVAAAIDTLQRVATILATDTSATIAEMLRLTEEYEIDPEMFLEKFDFAQQLKSAQIAALKASLIRVQKEEADRVELARLRAESEARAEADKKAAEAAERARLMKEREAREAERQADMVEAARLAEEQRVAREAAAIAQAAKNAEEKARRDAEAKAKAESDRIAREHAAAIEKERRLREEAEAKQRAEAKRIADEEAARKAEAARIKAEADKRATEEAKLAANKKHRQAVMTAAKVALMEHAGLSEDVARKVVLVISADKIPAVSMRFSG